MPNYRRLRIPGACYFFTVNLADRTSNHLTQNIEALRHAVTTARHHHPFTIDAFVVLPNHLHTVWTLPESDSDFSTRWSTIKRLFSWQIANTEPRSPSRRAKRERGLWQRRFWEHAIRDEADFRAHVDYVHFNPVKHGLVSHPRLWPHSTYHRTAARNELEPDGSTISMARDTFGERPHS